MIENRTVGVFLSVLIVAECNVNISDTIHCLKFSIVLIVAECNVNLKLSL